MIDLSTQSDISFTLVQHDMEAQHKSCVHGALSNY